MNWHQGDKLEIPIIGVVEFTGQLLGLLWFKLDERREIGLEAKAVEERLSTPTFWRKL